MLRESEIPISHSNRYQYLAIIIGNIISLCHGIAIGWLSPNFLKLQSNDSPLQSGPMTLAQTSWIGSCFSIGAILGNCFFGSISSFLGRKNTLCILALPNLLFWLMVLFGNDVPYLYIGRIFAGSTGGGMYICLPLFVAEIADQRIRGRLGSLLMLSVTTGILFGFIAGTYLTYYLVPKIFLPLPIVFFVLFIFFPETPQYFIARKSFDVKSKIFTELLSELPLQYLLLLNVGASLVFHNVPNICCSITSNINSDEFNPQKHHTNFEQKAKKIYKNNNNHAFRNRLLYTVQWKAIKAILIGFALTGINLFSGTFAMINYTATIFAKSGSELDPNVSSIIVAAIQIFGVYCSTIFVDRIGRKPLLIFSTSGAFIGLLSLGIYSYLNEAGYDLKSCNSIPLISFSTFVFTSCFGILPLPFIVLTEILPAEVRTFGTMICMLSNSIFAFISLKTFPILMFSWHLYGASWICAGVCFFGILFATFILEETKGKNLNECKPKMTSTTSSS